MAAVQTPTLIQGAEVVNGGALKATPINARFDIALVTPHIAAAEIAHLVPVIGEGFYQSLKTAKNGAISNYNPAVGMVAVAFTNTGLEALWREYIMEICAAATVYEALPWLAVQVGSNGIHLPNTEHAQSGGIDAAKFLQDQLKRRIQILQERLKAHLCAEATTYPGLDKAVIGCVDSCGCGEASTAKPVLSRFGIMYATKNNQ